MLLMIAAVLFGLAVYVLAGLLWTGWVLALALAILGLVAVVLSLLMSWDIKRRTAP